MGLLKIVKLLELPIKDFNSYIKLESSKINNVTYIDMSISDIDFYIHEHEYKIYGEINEGFKPLKLISDGEIPKLMLDLIEHNNLLKIVMNTIINIQQKFFTSGKLNDIAIMTLNDISKESNLDVSIISRVLKNKKIKTLYGVINAQFLLSKNVHNVSAKLIFSILLDLVNNEDKTKPYTDPELQKLINEKLNINLSRKTINEYRFYLNIQSSLERGRGVNPNNIKSRLKNTNKHYDNNKQALI